MHKDLSGAFMQDRDAEYHQVNNFDLAAHDAHIAGLQSEIPDIGMYVEKAIGTDS